MKVTLAKADAVGAKADLLAVGRRGPGNPRGVPR